MNFGFMNKNYTKKHFAYTLAEMLVVLVIISVVLISLPSATKKLFAVKEVKNYHGRFECYWDDDGKLNYFYMKERAGLAPEIKEGQLDGDVCDFVPPLTYPYLMIHAVGGGGAGGNLTDSVPAPEIVSSYTEYLSGQSDYQDKWFNKFIDKVRKSDELSEQFGINETGKFEYPTMITIRQVPLKYRKSGGAGSVVSMFFPFVPTGNRFYLYPGKGGELGLDNVDGADGKPSIVQVINNDNSEEGQETCDKTDENASCNLIWARGGKGAIVLDTNGEVINLVSTIALLGGKHSDFGISAYDDVKTKKSGFSDVIDKVNSTEAPNLSKISSDAGDGGNGANHYVKDTTTGFYFHEFDNYSGQHSALQGVNWVPVSKYVDANATYSTNCENKESGINTSSGAAGGLWLKRSAKSDVSTQCTINGSNYICAVGNVNRKINGGNCSNACGNSTTGRCACYTLNATGTILSTTNNFGASEADLSNYYRNPSLSDYMISGNTYKIMTIEENILNETPHIYCAPSSGNEYTVNGTSTPCKENEKYDITKGICKAKRGGHGAIVILW